MTLIRLVARPMLASTFVYGGVNALRNAGSLASAAKPVNDEIRSLAGKVAPQLPIPSDDKTMVRINAGVHIVAGLGLATGRAPRLSALALAATVLPTTVAGHRFWKERDAKAPQPADDPLLQERLDAGRPGARRRRHRGPARVAWRAQHAVGSAKREAKHLRREAKAQAKLARKSVTS